MDYFEKNNSGKIAFELIDIKPGSPLDLWIKKNDPSYISTDQILQEIMDDDHKKDSKKSKEKKPKAY